MTETRIAAVFRAIDQANAEDPNQEQDGDNTYPKEVLYAQRMSAWLQRLQPQANEPLRIAAHAQHIRRWEIPRDEFKTGLAGYLRWRKQLYQFHADQTEALMRPLAYPEEDIQRVRQLLLKDPKDDSDEAQTLEDVACLVFLDHYFAPFAAKHDDSKVVDIVRKTWHKMSPQAHQAALALNYPEPLLALIETALADTGPGTA